MKFKIFQPPAPEHAAELMLRWEVLRKPLGMPPGSEVIPEEKECLHMIALDGRRVVGCVLFCPESTEKGKLFQMAFSEEYQGKGFGRKLIVAMEDALEKRGYKDIYLHAREDSEGFYQKMGYQPEGDLIKYFSIPHRLMRKSLHSLPEELRI